MLIDVHGPCIAWFNFAQTQWGMFANPERHMSRAQDPYRTMSLGGPRGGMLSICPVGRRPPSSLRRLRLGKMPDVVKFVRNIRRWIRYIESVKQRLLF